MTTTTARERIERRRTLKSALIAYKHFAKHGLMSDVVRHVLLGSHGLCFCPRCSPPDESDDR